MLLLRKNRRGRVVVSAKGNRSNIKKLLEKAGYRNTTKGYVKGSDFSKTQTLCTFKGDPAILIFTKIKNRSL